MTEKQLEVCQLCLSLCRDVCPVAVHAFRDDLLPNHKVRAAAAVLRGDGGAWTVEQLDACTDCDACTTFCHFDVPVADFLRSARARVEPEAVPRAPPPSAPPMRASDLSDAVWLGCCRPEGEALDLPRVDPPLGSSCCGAKLPAGVDDADLHHAMARGMLADVPDGAVVVVADAACAAHLHASAAGRVKVVAADVSE